ncbi:MAG: hypothetical protein ACYC10_20770 [Allorhizobium sp.]
MAAGRGLETLTATRISVRGGRTATSDIYLDFNVGTPIAPEVADIMCHALETGHGNPSSGHWPGLPARQMVDEAGAWVGRLLGWKP